MGYKQLPVELCAPGTWPRGPFDASSTALEADPAMVAAAATVGRLAAALTNRRKTYGWSRAMLARQSGVGQHTIGKIETGRTWPDLATVARLARTLGLSLTMTSGEGSVVVDAVGTPASGTSGTTSGPLVLGAAVSAAQVIEALFARDPRLAAEVTNLRRNRLQAVQGGEAPRRAGNGMPHGSRR